MAEGLILTPRTPPDLSGPALKPPCLPTPGGTRMPAGGLAGLISLRTPPGCLCGCCWEVSVRPSQPMYPPQHLAMIAAAVCGAMDASTAARELLVQKFRLPGVDELFEMMIDRERKRRHGGRIACSYSLTMPVPLTPTTDTHPPEPPPP